MLGDLLASSSGKDGRDVCSEEVGDPDMPLSSSPLPLLPLAPLPPPTSLKSVVDVNELANAEDDVTDELSTSTLAAAAAALPPPSASRFEKEDRGVKKGEDDRC